MDGQEKEDPVKHRTALGEYVPPRGEKPLTVLARPFPGPADYELPQMDLHKLSSPDYTIRMKCTEKTDGRENWPCPNTYNPKLPTCKTVLYTTLKPKIEPPDYRCSPGPVHLVRTGDVDTKPGKTSIKGRHSPQATTGLPCPLDPTSFTKTPGPRYDPVVAHLPLAPRFLLNSQPRRDDNTTGPGPGRRNIRRWSLSGPFYSMRQRPHQMAPVMDNPPPDWYFVQDVLPAVHAPKMGELIKPRHRSPVPAPNAYRIRSHARPGPEMTFRPFESEPEFQTPGPGAYSPEVAPKKRAPAYSIRLPVKPTYPSQDRATYGYGPATYDTRGETAQRPAFKFNLRPGKKPNKNPAPNAYQPHEAPGTNNGFTLRIKPKDFKRPKAPAPNKYLPAKPLPHAPEYSLRIRHRDMSYKEKESVPAPDAYKPGTDCGCGLFTTQPRGASLKSRPSNYLFTGYDRARIPGCMSAQANRIRSTIS